MNRSYISISDKFEKVFQELTPDLNRVFIGHDHFFDGIRNAFGAYETYPPYDVEKIDDTHYRITLAVAGFTNDEIEIIKEDTWLTMSGKKVEQEDEEDPTFLYQGIAKRSFNRKVKLAADLVVNSATMKDGLLHIDLEKIIPEEKKPKKIDIK